MKFATAVSHLDQIGGLASENLRLRETGIGWPLEELWVGGALLDAPDQIDATPVVLVLDEPADDLSWLALHPRGDWIREQLRINKLPILSCYRPIVYPAWNCRDSRVVRFWSARDGLQTDVIQHLRQRDFGQLDVVQPSDDVLASQFEIELDEARRSLHRMLDEYWEPAWRREHRGFGVHPDDHLWRAAEAVRELEDAVAELRPRVRGYTP